MMILLGCGVILARLVAVYLDGSEMPTVENIAAPGNPLPEPVRLAGLFPIAATIPDFQTDPIPLEAKVEQQVAAGKGARHPLILKVNNVNFDALLVEGLRLETTQEAADTFSVTWTTMDGAETTFSLKPGKGRGKSIELPLDRNENWREVITSLTITCDSDETFAVGTIALIPKDITGAPSRIRVDRVLGDCIVQDAPYEYIYEMETHSAPVLSFGIRALSSDVLGDASASFAISLKSPGQEGWQEIFKEKVSSKESITFHKIPLQGFADTRLQIKLQVRALSGRPLGVWQNPIIYTRQPNPKHVALYIVDALRADHLEPYGYESGETPRITDFAADGVLFQNAYAQAPWTRPAFAAVISSLYPETHGVKHSMEVPERLTDEVTTLAEVFREYGYLTAGFIVNGFAQSYFGMDQGFDLSFEYPNKFPSVPYYVDVREVTTDLLGWLDKNADAPWLVIVFVVDPHEPYAPPLQYCELPECERPIDKYDAEIRFIDEYFGRFIDALQRLGIYENATICFTADHGEEFGEHGGYYHGNSLYEEVLHIPLLLKTPGSPASQKTEYLVEQVDIAPTLVSLAGLTPPAQWQGRSLKPIVMNEQPCLQDKPIFASLHRTVFSSEEGKTGENETGTTLSRYSVRKGNMKLIETRRADSSPEWQLFDLSKDMREKESSLLLRPLRFIDLYLTLKKLKNECRENAFSSTLVSEELSHEEINRLRAIGYLQ